MRHAKVVSLTTDQFIAHAKDHRFRWIYADKKTGKITERHWLCWKTCRMYHFMGKAGPPTVIELSLFRMQHRDVAWKFPK